MTPVVIDASALAAIAFNEPGNGKIVERLEGKTVCAPLLLKFELGNVAWKKARRQPAQAPGILASLTKALNPRWGIVWREVDHTDATLIGLQTGLTPYDASYLWLAGSLGAELVTLDTRLAAASALLEQSG